jgi:hypothetical protein
VTRLQYLPPSESHQEHRGGGAVIDSRKATPVAPTTLTQPAAGDDMNFDLQPSSECAMNRRVCNPLHERNKKRFAFVTRHNPA